MTDERPKAFENVDYELIPSDQDNDGWGIRILKGEFVETVFSFGALQVDGTDDDPMMNFDFGIISTPDVDLTAESIDLQLVVGDILLAILESAIENKEVDVRESK